jgi:hypothetical protein
MVDGRTTHHRTTPLKKGGEEGQSFQFSQKLAMPCNGQSAAILWSLLLVCNLI